MNNFFQFKSGVLKVCICLLLLLVVGLNQKVYAQDDTDKIKQAANIPHAEDYESEQYLLSVKGLLNKKINHIYKESEDWAIIGFIIDRDGKIPKTWICSSSGNDTINDEALSNLQKTKLPALEEGSPPAVKVFYNVNMAQAHKAAKESAREKLEDARANKLEGLEQLTGDNKNPKLFAFEMMALFVVIALLSSVYQIVFGFFLAGAYWWLHRLFLGQFPS